LLEFELVANSGEVALRPNPFARKTTGSYYTPDELVQLIIRQVIEPLLDERRGKFRNKASALAHDRRPRSEHARELAAVDAASAFVDLRVCDPAMRSGHFPVSLVYYPALAVLQEIAEAPNAVSWMGEEAPSPLALHIEVQRAHIRAAADANSVKDPTEPSCQSDQCF
jgi:hypothetical protein